MSSFIHLGLPLQQSEATAARAKLLFNATAGTSWGVEVSKDGAAFVAATGSATNIAGELYQVVPAAADLDTEGAIALRMTATANGTVIITSRIVNYDVYDYPTNPAAIADAVWTEDLTGHVAATDAATKLLNILDDTGTNGVQIATNQSIQTVGNLANAARTQAASAVWAHNLSGYTAAAVTNATQAGEALKISRQRLVGFGEWDSNTNQTYVYDQDETTVLVQLDHATTAPTTARTPS